MKNIVIVGLGLVGGSFAKAIKAKTKNKYRVFGIDKDKKALEKSLEDGVILEGQEINKDLLQKADLVILTLYPRDIVDFVERHKNEFKKGAIVTDVTGIKEKIVGDILEVLPNDIEFIFGHPMAGKENRGYAYASAEVFEGANYLICPVEGNTSQNIDLFIKFVKELGFENLSKLSPQKHDRAIGYTSQLCHLISVALVNSDQDLSQTADFAGDSYRDLTRIAKINEDLWSQLFLANKDNLLSLLKKFQNQIDIFKESLENNNEDQLKKLFIESTKRRIKFEEDSVKKTDQK